MKVQQGNLDRLKGSSGNTGLRERLIQAASKVLVEEGYDNLSMRRVAQEAGCSQMAMYRHFANKEALTQHLCTLLYVRFTAEMHREMDTVDQPWEKVRIFIASLIQFAVSYPDHYSLVFLVRHPDPEVIAEREHLGQEFLQGIHQIVHNLLPEGTPRSVITGRLRQLLSCLHGTAALLIAHPKAYGLTKQKAIKDVQEAAVYLLNQSSSFLV